MDFEEFLENQESIYSGFRDTAKLGTDGIVPNTPQTQGGYMILLRHPEIITDKLGILSEKIGGLVPSIGYNNTNGHTTISDYLISEDFSPDNSILLKLAQSVNTSMGFFGRFTIEFTEWLMNQNTGISAGKPTKGFYDCAQTIVNSVKIKGVDLRMPWGAHITACRFIEKRSPKEALEVYRLFIQERPLGMSKPQYLDVGYFSLSSGKLDITVYDRFKL